MYTGYLLLGVILVLAGTIACYESAKTGAVEMVVLSMVIIALGFMAAVASIFGMRGVPL